MNFLEQHSELFPDDLSKDEAILLTAEQINKDFGAEVITIVNNHVELQQLLDGVRMYIATIPYRNAEKLVQLLYRVDLKENTVREILQHPNPESILEDLTNEVIRRELLKVLMRRYFSRTNTND
ncbi:MAG: hypothetical protein RL226_588 [Bacteroidota bacterium]|jgi:hypothetical protein